MSAAGWHPEEIKAAIRMRGTTPAALSSSGGFHKDAVRLAIKHRRAPAVELLIAELLNVHPRVIWPDRYHEDGSPLSADEYRAGRRQQKTKKLVRVTTPGSKTATTRRAA